MSSDDDKKPQDEQSINISDLGWVDWPSVDKDQQQSEIVDPTQRGEKRVGNIVITGNISASGSNIQIAGGDMNKFVGQMPAQSSPSSDPAALIKAYQKMVAEKLKAEPDHIAATAESLVGLLSEEFNLWDSADASRIGFTLKNLHKLAPNIYSATTQWVQQERQQLAMPIVAAVERTQQSMGPQ